MTGMIYICEAVLEQTHLESGLEKVFAGVSHAVFGRYAADIYIFCVEELQNLSERLSGFVDALEARVLFFRLVTSFVKSQFLAGVRLEIFMYIPSAGASDAVGRPYASLLLE